MRDDPKIRELLALDIPPFMSAHDLGEFLGIGERQITALAKRGILQKLSNRKFDVRESTLAYIGHAKKTGNVDLDAEKVRLAREQADRIELQNQETRRTLVPAADVQREWESVLRDVRSAMLRIPSRLQHLPPQDVAAIDRAIRDSLSETANAK